MSETGAVRRRRSQAEVEALVAEFEASELMREAFCQQPESDADRVIRKQAGIHRE